LSLVLCVMGIVFWVRGHFYKDMVDWRDSWQVARADGRMDYHSRQTVVWSGIGEFRFSTQHNFSVEGPVKIVEHGPGAQLFFYSGPPSWKGPSKQARYVVDRWGFRVGEINQPAARGWVHVTGIAVPPWGWVVFFGLLPAVRGILALRRKRVKDGDWCRTCGYDLRESKERCPECGTSIA